MNIETDFSRQYECALLLVFRRNAHQPRSAQNRRSQFPSPEAIAVQKEKDQAGILDRSCRTLRPHCYAARPLVDSQSYADPYLKVNTRVVFPLLSFQFNSSRLPL